MSSREAPDFHELWRSVMSACLFTEVKGEMGYISSGMGDSFSALLMSLIALRLVCVCITKSGSRHLNNFLLLHSYRILELLGFGSGTHSSCILVNYVILPVQFHFLAVLATNFHEITGQTLEVPL